MSEKHNSSIVRSLIFAAFFLVYAGLLWPLVAPWYNGVIIASIEPIAPRGVVLEVSGTSILLSRDESAGPVSLPGLPLHLALLVSLAVVVATPNMRILVRCGSALGVALLVGLSHILFLQYLTHVLGKGDITDIPAMFAMYWSVFPGIIAAIWCYLFWLPRWTQRLTVAVP